MKYRLKADHSVECEAMSEDLGIPGQVAYTHGGVSYRAPTHVFVGSWEPVPEEKPDESFNHFDRDELFRAVNVGIDHNGSFWALKNGLRDQRLDSAVVEYVAGKMLDPAVRRKVLAATRVQAHHEDQPTIDTKMGTQLAVGIDGTGPFPPVAKPIEDVCEMRSKELLAGATPYNSARTAILVSTFESAAAEIRRLKRENCSLVATAMFLKPFASKDVR